jgi:hypothetical protein
MTIAFAVKDGVASMRFETHDSALMLFRHVDSDLGGLPDARVAVVHRTAYPQPARRAHATITPRGCFFGLSQTAARSAPWR